MAATHIISDETRMLMRFVSKGNEFEALDYVNRISINLIDPSMPVLEPYGTITLLTYCIVQRMAQLTMLLLSRCDRTKIINVLKQGNGNILSTTLMFACQKEMPEVVAEILLLYDLNINHMNKTNSFAYDYALEHLPSNPIMYESIATILLTHHNFDKSGVLSRCIMRTRQDRTSQLYELKFLLDNGIDIHSSLLYAVRREAQNSEALQFYDDYKLSTKHKRVKHNNADYVPPGYEGGTHSPCEYHQTHSISQLESVYTTSQSQYAQLDKQIRNENKAVKQPEPEQWRDVTPDHPYGKIILELTD